MSAEEQPKSIRAMIVDDEALARSNVVLSLRPHPEIEIVSECASGMEALTGIRHGRPDLVFLDVEMPECDGFDVLEMLGGDLPPAVIFVTAFDEYALRAFEAGGLDYLLKPFDDARFGRALNRAKEKLAHYLPPRGRGAGRIVVKSQGQVLFLNVADIDWVEAAGYYACLHVGRETHILRRSLSELEEDLGD